MLDLGEVGLSSGSLAGRLEIRVRARRQGDRSDLSGIRSVGVVSAIDSAVRVECAGDAAVIVGHDIAIAPLSSDLNSGATLRAQVSKEKRVIISVERDLFAVGIQADAAAHAASQSHAEDFAARGTEIGIATDRRGGIDVAARGTRLELHIDYIFSALTLQSSPSVPVGKNMKLSAEKESPRGKNGSDEQNQDASEGKDQHQPW